MIENTFCYLKGIVNCDSATILDCNGKRVRTCKLEQEKASNEQGFCYLKGLVDCSPGRIQDCNNRRTKKCILENK